MCVFISYYIHSTDLQAVEMVLLVSTGTFFTTVCVCVLVPATY